MAVVFGGLAVGKYMSVRNQPLSEAEIAAEQAKETQQEFEEADYVVSPPTFGPIIQTLSLDVIYEDDQAFAFVSNEEAKIIEVRRSVILYDQEDYVLPLGGTVSSIEQTETGQNKVTISLPEQTNTELLAGNVDIITLETVASKRLPLSALQKENGQHFVWTPRYNQESNEITLSRLHIKVGLSDEEYFVENGEKIDSHTPIVINPDNKTKADKAYSIFATEIAGSLHNPIRQAWIDYELYRLEQEQKELNQIAEDCKNGKKSLIFKPGAATNPDGSMAMPGCNQQRDPNKPLDPMQIFNSLVNSGTSSGCGNSSSAGCGN